MTSYTETLDEYFKNLDRISKDPFNSYVPEDLVQFEAVERNPSELLDMLNQAP